MIKQYFRIYMLLVLNLLLMPCAFAQISRSISVGFELGDKNISFGDEVKLIININGQEIQPLMYLNGFIVPDLKGANEVDVCFIYKGIKHYFRGLPVIKFETNWVFGIVKKSKEKKVKREYYLKFNSDKGDGTMVTVTTE